MRNITVSVDEETHRMARVRAAELDTSVSALVRGYLRSLAAEDGVAAGGDSRAVETPNERRRRLLKELREDIRATSGGFRASDNIPRDELYERRAVR
ncbi:MAG: hypothetical protein OXH46_12175 [Gemmatimonadetes bacterium]|nr:hypothetical protein [Candidatus Palauibacter australiensis]MCY3700365.1 hypothetical protein [Gemmatimonadota bacterium]MCZ0935482.1 hypothetical protein [Candidatus Palauibacter rhopaloidicola]